MADLDKIEEKLLAIQEDVAIIRTLLKGYNGSEGLCDKVEAHTKAINRLWLTVTAIAVSLGGGIYGVVQAFIR